MEKSTSLLLDAIFSLSFCRLAGAFWGYLLPGLTIRLPRQLCISIVGKDGKEAALSS